MNTFLFLSGPSRTGIRHVRQNVLCFSRFFKELPIMTSRDKRVHEVEGSDGFFRTREEIEALATLPDRCVTEKTKHNLTAIDTQIVLGVLHSQRESGIMVVSPVIGAQLANHKAFAGKSVSTIFLTPITLNETETLLKKGGVKALRAYLFCILKARAESLAKARNLVLTDEQSDKAAERDITPMMKALSFARLFKHVVPSPWSGHEYWQVSPVETAAETVRAIYSIIKGVVPADAEYSKQWPAIPVD